MTRNRIIIAGETGRGGLIARPTIMRRIRASPRRPRRGGKASRRIEWSLLVCRICGVWFAENLFRMMRRWMSGDRPRSDPLVGVNFRTTKRNIDEPLFAAL